MILLTKKIIILFVVLEKLLPLSPENVKITVKTNIKNYEFDFFT
jgi:hypothetical protein